MNRDYEQCGHGIARDGRRFNPPIPAGATVSWKRMAEPLYIPDRHRMATHILAVWDHLELMGVDPADLRDTPRGPCLAYYADGESIEDLIESAVPAPACVDADVPTEVVLAEYVAAAREQWLSVSRTRDAPTLLKKSAGSRPPCGRTAS